MATTKGLYTTNRTYVGMLRGTYATVQYVLPTYTTDPLFRFNSLLLTGETDYLPFNADNSLNNFNVTVVGDAKASNFSPYTPGYYSAFFDGTGDYLSAGDQTEFEFGSGAYTVELWWFATSSADQNLIGKWVDSSGAEWILQWRNAGYFRWAVGGSVSSDATTSLPLNVWNHIAVSKSGTSLRIFLNGSQINTTANEGTISATSSSLTIGTSQVNTTPNYTTGYISNVRIVKGTALYTAAFTPPTSPLTAISGTSLLTCQDNRFIDRSTNNFAITVSGDSKISAAVPFDVPASFASYGSAYFDGASDYVSIPNSPLHATLPGDFTAECWFYLNNVSTTQLIFSHRTNGYCPFLIWASSASLLLYVSSDNASWNIINGDTLTTVAAGQWYHLAYTRTGSTFRVFINGIQVKTFSSSASFTTSNSLQLGMTTLETNSSLNGYISDFRFVKGTGVYTGNFTPPSAPVSISGSTSQYAVTANVNTTFPSANTSLSLLQYSQPHNNSTFLDKSNFRQVIARNGNATQGSFSPYGQNWSGYFDGTGDYLAAPTSSNLVFGTGDFCVEMWYYQATNATAGLFSNSVSSGGGDAQFEIQIASSTFYPTVYGWNTAFLTSSVASTGGAWNHLVVCRNGTTLSMFLNGVRVATTTTSNNFSSTNAFNIGRQASNGAYLTGYISNLRVAKGSSVYDPTQSTITVPTSPLTAVSGTSLLTCQSNRFIDNSTNNFAITVNGDTSIQKSSPFGLTANASPTFTGGSAYFDTNGDYIGSPQSATYNLSIGNWTIEAWYYSFSDLSQSARYMTFIPSSGSTYGILPGNGAFILNLFGSSSPISTSIPSTLYRWQHIALVKSGSTTTLYINGIAGGSGTVSWVDAPTAIYVGGNPGGYAYYFSGYVSDFRFVRNAVYTGNFTLPSLPLTLSGNSSIYSNTTNVNTTFSVANTNLMLNFTEGAIKDSTMYIDAKSVGDAKLGFETPYSGSYYSNYFDSSGDYFTCSTSSAQFGTGNFTVEFWIYPTTVASAIAVIDFRSSVGASYGQIYINTDGTVHFYLPTDIATTNSVVINTWNHVAITRTAGTLQMFINGVSGYSASNSGTFNAAAVTIGAAVNGGSGVNGYISNLRFVTGTGIYTTAFTPPTSPLTAVSGTSLLTCQSNRFIDNSTNNFTITKTGETAVRSFNPFQRNTGSSLFFDGSGDYLQIPSSTQEIIGTANATVEFWMYPLQTDGYRRIVTTTNGGFNAGSFFIRFNNGNFLYGTGTTNATATTPAANTWTHVAWVGTNNGSNQTLYFNGNVVSTTTTYSITEAIQFVGGYYTTGPAEYFAGYIDDLRVTKGNVRYTANFTPSINMLPVR
jgi:hypothetical protein